MTKLCLRCKTHKDTQLFGKNKNNKDGLSTYCKPCVSKYFKKKHYSRLYQNKLRLDIIRNYGNQCSICGENNIKFLCIDHICGNGTKHRKELGGTHAFWRWLRVNNYPKGYRVLCQNCNQIDNIERRKRDRLERQKSRDKEQFRNSNYKHKQYNKIKDIVFKHYGNMCVCCGESRKEALSIDRINGGGKRHCAAIGGPDKLCRWIKKNEFPKEFRILCHNCNFSIGQYGHCPHGKTNEEKDTMG